jgi:rRNA-processing protein FCF1
MRALLDTNIIIHRENKRVTNYSIGHLFRWLDNLRYVKVIHPYSIEEIRKYRDPETQEALGVKLESYNKIQTIKEPDITFLSLLNESDKTEKDLIDNTLLYEVYLRRVNILITEDRRLRDKANKLGIGDNVFSINSFISKVSAENPSLIEYKMLAVRKTLFGNVEVGDTFFNSFRVDYDGFDQWFLNKCDEEAYICKNDEGDILGFLYVKTEGVSENYSDIQPQFKPKRRLKVGTFKVESTGFRLGERFIKIIFDNALQRNVDEVYITMFTDRDELTRLYELLLRWGFIKHGTKLSIDKRESVLVKRMKEYDSCLSVRENFPNILYSCKKYVLPIYPQYHTSLLPDSKLNNENEVDFLGSDPHRYALQKVYISWAPVIGVDPGDLILFYRTGEGVNKRYTSVVSTVALVDEIITGIKSEDDLLQLCQNRSVFSTDELKDFWRKHRYNIKILKFIFVKSLTRRLPLDYLWTNRIIPLHKGPRPFTRITDEQFEMILRDSKTELTYIES